MYEDIYTLLFAKCL